MRYIMGMIKKIRNRCGDEETSSNEGGNLNVVWKYFEYFTSQSDMFLVEYVIEHDFYFRI